MSVTRLFVEADLAAGIEASLGEAQVHYLRHVMRRPDGAPLLLFNGRDGEWQAALAARGAYTSFAALSPAGLRASLAAQNVELTWPRSPALLAYLAAEDA